MKHPQPSSMNPKLFFIYLLAGTVLADRFRFGVTNITTISTREWHNDTLLLTIGSVVGDQGNNNSFPLGWNHTDGTSVVMNNLTHEIDVPIDGLNVSVAFAVVNLGNETPEEGAILDTVQNVLGIASNIPGYLGVGISLVNFFLQSAQLFNCSGPLAIDHVRYTNDTLANLQIGKPRCETKSYQRDSEKLCGSSDYSVSYCFERLDGPTSDNKTNTCRTQEGVGASRPSAAFLGFSIIVTASLALYT